MVDLLGEACAQLGVTVKRPIFTGGQKQVLLVEGPNGEHVLKFINLGIATDPQALERARREVALLRSVDHPNVVQVQSDLLELGAPVEAAAWLEEYLTGSDLRSAITGPWTADEVLRLGLDMSRGLGALHEKHVVHRDLSPGNVHKTLTGAFKVLDPGFAKHTLKSGITVGGQPGTPGFMTPEHLQSKSGSPTAASDVFGCGTLMYLAATRTPPIPYKGNDIEYMQRLRIAQHEPLSRLRADLPDPLIEVIERALHAQPARRYRNGNRLAQALGQL